MPKKAPTPPTENEMSLLKSAKDGDLQSMQTLIAGGVNVNVKFKQSKSVQFDPPLVALISAACNTTSLVSRNGKLVPIAKDLWDQKDLLLGVIRSLLAAGADPNAVSSFGNPSLVSLCRRVPEEISVPIGRILLEHGAIADVPNDHDSAALLTAATYRSIAFARLLLEHSADVNRFIPRGTVLDIIEDAIKSAKEDVESARSDSDRDEFKATLSEIESFRELLKSRGAKHKAELDVPAPIPEPEKRHVASDFLKLVNSGEAEWAMIAVKAPFEAVSDAYLKFSKGKSREQNVPVRPAAEAQEIPPLTAIVKVAKSPWTLILRTIFWVRMPDINHVKDAAKDLSQTLKTRALSWAGTEETDNGMCQVFENGEKVASAGSGKAIALLTKEEMVLPAFYPTLDKKEAWVAVEKRSAGMVERADLISR